MSTTGISQTGDGSTSGYTYGETEAGDEPTEEALSDGASETKEATDSSSDDDSTPRQRTPRASKPSDVAAQLEEAGLKLGDVRTNAFEDFDAVDEGPRPAGKPKTYEAQEWRVDEDGTAYRRGAVKYPNGDLYDGEWVNGKRHGNGQFLYKSGDKYIGEFRAGKYDGFGVLAFADFRENNVPMVGRRYQGMFKDGLRHGEGLYIVGNGDIYEGEFAFGKFNGKGKYKYLDGSVYEGEWVDGLWQGQGIYRLKNGDVYRGEFQEGRMHGKGHYKWRRRTGTYSGDFRYNRRHGHGRRVFLNGSVYDGDYVNNVMSGEGVFRSAGGDVYIGSFRQDLPHGNGTLQLAMGDRYVGQFQRGVFCGRGRYDYADGGYYDGDYFAVQTVKRHSVVFPKYDGKRHGKGVRVWSDGNRYEGEWEDDEMRGFGVLTGVWGGVYQVYEGEVEGNQRHGKGVCVYGNKDRVKFTCVQGRHHDGRNTCKYDGQWQNGQYHGEGVYTCADGRRYEGTWRHGKRHGHGRQVLMGDLEKGNEARMFRGGLDALYRAYIYEGEWHHNRREGKGMLFMENGDKYSGVFVNGHLHGPVRIWFQRIHAERGALYNHGTRVRWLTHEELSADKALQLLARRLPSSMALPTDGDGGAAEEKDDGNPRP